MRYPWVAAASAALLILAGCDARPGYTGPTVPIGQSSRTLTVDGRHRTVHLYRPATLDSPAPLVVMLHGGFASGGQTESAYGWDAEADAGHFLVAYPDGLDRAWSVGGGCCGVPGRTGVDDVRFVTAMLDDIRRAVPVGPARAYATGISNGGLLAYRLACDTSDFAAIGPDSATMLGTAPRWHRRRSSTSTAPPTPGSPTTSVPARAPPTSTGRPYRTWSPPGAPPSAATRRR